jgi:hypothetical protein
MRWNRLKQESVRNIITTRRNVSNPVCTNIQLSWVEFILRPTVSRPVRLGIGQPFGAHDQIYLALLFLFFWLTVTFTLFPTASSLTRGRVCSLECLHSLVRSLTTRNHILPSHLRLCSLSVASYDSQGLRWRYSNPPANGSLNTKCLLSHI